MHIAGMYGVRHGGTIFLQCSKKECGMFAAVLCACLYDRRFNAGQLLAATEGLNMKQ